MDDRMAGKTLLKSDLVLSPAYNALKVSGLRVLNIFLLKQPMDKVGPKEWVPKDTGNEMRFTYIEAKKLLGFTGPRFTRAIDDLIENGFIEQKYQGGGAEGDRSSYVLIDMWRLFGTDQFRVRPRPKKGLNIGFIKNNKKKKYKRTTKKKIVNIRE